MPDSSYIIDRSRSNRLDALLTNQSKLKNGYAPNYVADDGLHTLPVDYDCKCKKTPNYYPRKDELGIYNLGGNVSEWIDESYQRSYKSLFDSIQEMRMESEQEDLILLAQIEKYYDQRNDSTGMLVRGANWYDERYAYKMGKNVAGTNAKVFVDPNKSHSTLGFRYVIYVYPIEK